MTAVVRVAAVLQDGALVPSGETLVGVRGRIYCDGATYTIEPADVFNIDARFPQSVAMGGALIEASGTTSAVRLVEALSGPTSYPGVGTLRFAKVVDPNNASEHCWFMCVASDDLDTAGSKRTEFSCSTSGHSKIPYGSATVVGLVQRYEDWSATSDEQICWQFHDNTSVSGLSPWLAMYVSGSTWTVRARYDAASVPSQIGTEIVDLASGSLTPGEWWSWAIEAREGAGGHGYARIMLNGVTLCEYTGRLGYYDARQPASYFKCGVYHWSTGNSWDATMPTRSVWVKGCYIAPVNAVSIEDMAQIMETL